MRPCVMALTVVLVAATFAVGAPVAEAKPKIAVLGIEPVDPGAVASQQKTTELARALTEALRARAARARAHYDIAPNSNKELTEVKLLSDCFDEGKECMAQIGRDLGADMLLFGKLEKKKDGYAITLRLLNVPKTAFEKQKTQAVAPGDATPAGMERHAIELFGELTGVEIDSMLIVRANVPTGTVFVGGVPRGVLVGGRVVVGGLDEGTYRVAVESPGHRRWEGDVLVGRGQRVNLQVHMKPEGDDLSADRGTGEGEDIDDGGGTYRILTWTSAVVTAGGLTAFTISALQVKSAQSDHDELVTAWQMTREYEQNGIQHPGSSCREAEYDAADTGLDAVARSKARAIDEACRRGESASLRTYIFGGVSAAALVATAIFAYKGYIAPERAAPSPPSASARAPRKPSRRVLLSPELVPSGVGLGATIQF